VKVERVIISATIIALATIAVYTIAVVYTDGGGESREGTQNRPESGQQTDKDASGSNQPDRPAVRVYWKSPYFYRPAQIGEDHAGLVQVNDGFVWCVRIPTNDPIYNALEHGTIEPGDTIGEYVVNPR
jgi:hypothetical protein